MLGDGLYQEEFDLALYTAQFVGTIITDIYYDGLGMQQVARKKDLTPVTLADTIANDYITTFLKGLFPRDTIVSEEEEIIRGSSGRGWYIDPLDGTTHFANHTDQFAVHIGLVVNSEPVMGIVYKPTTKEYYWAIKGRGAYRKSPTRERLTFPSIRLPSISNCEVGLISDVSFLLSDAGRATIKNLGDPKVDVSGSCGLRFMRVAEGFAESNFSNCMGRARTWDICAPQIIAEEAGATVAYLDGSPVRYDGGDRLRMPIVVTRNKLKIPLIRDAYVSAHGGYEF